MNIARVKARMATIRAELDDLEKTIDEETDADGAPSAWMTVPQYARASAVHPETVRRWLRQGMPCVKDPIRLNRDECDAWRKSR